MSDKSKSKKSNPVMFSRQADELDFALERNNCPPEFVKWLSTGDNLASVRDVWRGYAEIKPIEHLIDCDADPFVPRGLTVAEHQKSGPFTWDPFKVRLYLSNEQKYGNIKGNELRNRLASKPVLNANVLDYLLKNPRLIPEEWKGKLVFFWGTIYRDSDGGLCVRCLYWCWRDGGWNWDYNWLDNVWNVSRPAALRAS